LSPSQYTCLLGMKITKDNRPLTPAKTISTRVALIDLAPTIAALVGLPEKLKTDGLSLLPSLLSSSEPPANRVFMLESGMLPNQFISREKARLYGILLFRVNPENGLLELREDKLEHINAMKIYGVI
ncbi:sulfatase, partial [Legionella pneumophila]